MNGKQLTTSDPILYRFIYFWNTKNILKEIEKKEKLRVCDVESSAPNTSALSKSKALDIELQLFAR